MGRHDSRGASRDHAESDRRALGQGEAQEDHIVSLWRERLASMRWAETGMPSLPSSGPHRQLALAPTPLRVRVGEASMLRRLLLVLCPTS
jgi:hypothetical protein